MKTGRDVRNPGRSARIKIISVCEFEQGNVCKTLRGASVFISELVFAITSTPWAAPCSTEDFNPFKIRVAGSSPSQTGFYVDIQYYFLRVRVWENCSPQVQADLWISPSYHSGSQKEKSGGGPAISLDQEELLLGKESERKKCQTRHQRFEKAVFRRGQGSLFIVPSSANVTL